MSCPLTYIKNSSIAPSNEFNPSLKMTSHSKLMQIYLGASTLKNPPYSQINSSPFVIEQNCLTVSTGNSENIFVTYFLQSPLSLFLVLGLLMNLCSWILVSIYYILLCHNKINLDVINKLVKTPMCWRKLNVDSNAIYKKLA